MFNIEVSMGICSDRDDVESDHLCRRWISPMGIIGNEDLCSSAITPLLMVGSNHSDPGKFPLCSGIWQERSRLHSRDHTKHLNQLKDQLQVSLDGAIGGQGMGLSKSRKGRRIFVNAWIELHRTASQWIELGIDPHVPS